MVDLEGKSGIFPKVEKDGWTGIAFVNTENEQATVTLKAYTNTGTVVATGTKTLGAHAKWVGRGSESDESVPRENQSELNSATYISYSADRNVAGFQLNNSTATPCLTPSAPGSSPSGQKTIDKALGLLQIPVHGHLRDDGGDRYPDPDTVGHEHHLSAGYRRSDRYIISKLSPPAITITVSYGNGCPASDGSTVSGQVVLAITNLSVDSDLRA